MGILSEKVLKRVNTKIERNPNCLIFELVVDPSSGQTSKVDDALNRDCPLGGLCNPPASKASRGVFLNQAQKNFTHPSFP